VIFGSRNDRHWKKAFVAGLNQASRRRVMKKRLARRGPGDFFKGLEFK